jgi:hypothetical protein
MEASWRQAFSGGGALKLLVIAILLMDILTEWRTDDPISVGFRTLVFIGVVVEYLRPDASVRPDFVKVVALLAICTVVFLLPTGFLRRAEVRPRDVGRQVVPSTLRVTPEQGAQGETQEVTITGASPRFTDRSVAHFGAGIAVLSTRSVGNTALAARIQIATDTPIGRRRIWVSTPGEQTAMDDSPRGAFEVTIRTAEAR